MRASRLLSILIMLQMRGRLSAESLAQEFEVSIRTIYRDIDQLSAAGVPVYAERGRAGGFELREEADRYVLVSKIPEAQAKNVSVNVDNDRFVTITTKQDKSSQTGGLSAFSASSSTQSITLPGPVKVERMTMDYKNGQLEVTLPKA